MATPTNLPASFSVGQTLTASDMNNLRGAFRILQVVEGSYATESTNSTTTYADTGVTASITPTSTSSKILIIVNHSGCYKTADNASQHLVFQLLRGATSLTTFENGAAYNGSLQANWIGSVSQFYLDSPSTTSSTTYKTQFKGAVAANKVGVQGNNSRSSIILFEISA